MKVSEIDGCDNCPLLEESICPGGMTSGAGGIPIEPPCVSWNDDDDIDDIIQRHYDAEAYYEDLEKQMYKKNRLKEEKAAKSAFVRSWSRSASREVKRLKSLITKTESAKRTLENLSSSFSIVNEMLGYSEGKSTHGEFERSQERKVKEAISPYDKRLIELNEELKVAEEKLALKRKEAREQMNYKRAGLRRKPEWRVSKGQFWYENVLDYMSVKTEDYLEECQKVLSKEGYTRQDSIQVFVEDSGLWYLHSYNGINWEALGYVDLTEKKITDKEFKLFINSLLKDIVVSFKVIVMPSHMEKFSFFGDYPACYKTLSVFKEAWIKKHS